RDLVDHPDPPDRSPPDSHASAPSPRSPSHSPQRHRGHRGRRGGDTATIARVGGAMRLAGIFAAIMLLMSAGCHSSKPDPHAAPDAGATLTVANQGFSDVTIYVVSGTT